MTDIGGLKAYFEELVKKHRKLDEDITELQKSYNVHEEVRRLKTQKLFYKDELHRVKSQIESTGLDTNGSN
jgi:uncharacterized protein YdcH (DUF465 family)